MFSKHKPRISVPKFSFSAGTQCIDQGSRVYRPVNKSKQTSDMVNLRVIKNLGYKILTPLGTNFSSDLKFAYFGEANFRGRHPKTPKLVRAKEAKISSLNISYPLRYHCTKFHAFYSKMHNCTLFYTLSLD